MKNILLSMLALVSVASTSCMPGPKETSSNKSVNMLAATGEKITLQVVGNINSASIQSLGANAQLQQLTLPFPGRGDLKFVCKEKCLIAMPADGSLVRKANVQLEVQSPAGQPFTTEEIAQITDLLHGKSAIDDKSGASSTQSAEGVKRSYKVDVGSGVDGQAKLMSESVSTMMDLDGDPEGPIDK